MKVRKFTINLLLFNRIHALPIHLHFLRKIKHWNNVQLNIVDQYNSELAKQAVQQMQREGFNVQYVNLNTYMDKIHYASKSDSEYVVKLDDDIVMNNHVWDYMFEQAAVLDDPKNILLAPTLSSGIPTTEQFAEDVFTAAEQEVVNDLKRRTTFRSSLWGNDYTFLHAATVNSDKWDGTKFYAVMNAFPGYYKGHHPVRENPLVVKKINEFVLLHLDKIINAQNYYLEYDGWSPYLCNSCFMIKTVVWRFIVEDKSKFVDAFDEVPLNTYRKSRGLNFVFIRNSNAIHPVYNTYPTPLFEYERWFIQELKRLLSI